MGAGERSRRAVATTVDALDTLNCPECMRPMAPVIGAWWCGGAEARRLPSVGGPGVMSLAYGRMLDSGEHEWPAGIRRRLHRTPRR